MIRPTPPPTFAHPDSRAYFFRKASRLTICAPPLSWRGGSSAVVCSTAEGMSVLDALFSVHNDRHPKLPCAPKLCILD